MKGGADGTMEEPERSDGRPSQATTRRWECACGERPVLFATYDERGEIRIKFRDRFFFVYGRVRAICPRCGAEHVLDLREREARKPATATD
ncbi:MAG TPA: hypothetical protein VFQ80_14810 [Thermomicrobiales bacterium]|nr:hypothetical protein [Thermomicrobiales bacterium]